MNEKRPDPEEPTAPDAWRLTRFFIPLAVQAASQSLCYPLVTMVASRGPAVRWIWPAWLNPTSFCFS